MQILKMRVALLGLVALLITSGVATSVASAAGPFWHVGGATLKGTRQIKLQLKTNGGSGAKLTAETAGEPFIIECKNAISEGATIEGDGAKQGQGKGRIAFSSCKTSIAACFLTEPVVTNPTKSYLADAESTQSKFAEVFEPGQGEVFINLVFTGKCGVITVNTPLPVKGSVAAELIPGGKESQEGLLNFPVKAITEVKHEGTVVKPLMQFAGVTSVFSGALGARLQTGEAFGVFST